MKQLKKLRVVFFPINFVERYSYLGYLPCNSEGKVFVALLPLILTMDYYAKPKWCPRWILRLLNLLGNDNSSVRVRNFFFHNMFRRLTKGIMLIDYKLKWSHYDLRIYVHGTDELLDLADDIENAFYKRGRREFLLEELDKVEELKGTYEKWTPLHELEELYNKEFEPK